MTVEPRTTSHPTGPRPVRRLTASDHPLELAADRSADLATRSGFASSRPDDIAGARLHVDRDAAGLARRRGARAFTVGTDVYFGDGAFAPDTSQGRHLIAHELAHVAQARRGQAPEGLVMRQVIPELLDFDNLAARIHEAISGPGTDEEAVYVALQQLELDPARIAQLEARYQQRFGVTLQADIEDDFSGEELEYAFQLLGRGTAGSAQAILSKPTSQADLDAAARRLRAAMDIIGTDEEAIYAVLRPFDRDFPLLERLRAAYQALTGEDLRDRIVGEMSSTELDYALYLLGGPPIRAEPEITEMIPAQVARIFADLSQLTFVTSNRQEAPVPFHYPIDGCYSRAQMMANRLTELGFASEKVFSIARTPASTIRGDLHVESPFAGDVAAPAVPTVTWWYHVAPIVRVREANGSVHEMVLDPAMHTQPLELNAWLQRMGNAAASRISPDEARSRSIQSHGEFAPGDHIVFTFDRNAFMPGDLESPTPATAQEQLEKYRPTLTAYAQAAEVHELAAAIRGASTGAGVDVPAIITAIRAAPKRARQRLPHPQMFRQLLFDLHARVTAAEWQAIVNEVNAP